GCFGHFLLGRKVGPIEGDAVRPVRPIEGPLQALRVIDVGCDYFRALLRQLAAGRRVHVPRQRAHGKARPRVVQNSPCQSAALRAGGAQYGNHVFVRHSFPPIHAMNCSILEFQVSVKAPRGSLAIRLLLLAALCVLAYGSSLSIPLIEDDFPNLWESHAYGPLAALPVLLHSSVFRLRATSYWTMWPLWRLFHTTAWPYHLFSLLLHVANVWLAYAIAALWPRMRPAAFWAAAFFAVAEGHQEAVMWFSAIGELYMFLFGGASLALWLLACRPGSRWFLQAASAVLFALALLSKESAVIFLPLFLLAAPAECWESWKRSLVRLLPHLALAALAIASVAASRGSSFRFSDGSFSLHAPFWFTWPYGVARVLWVWGWIALAEILWFRTPSLWKPAFRALSWIGIALAPYSFLTYSRQIPSRQT